MRVVPERRLSQIAAIVAAVFLPHLSKGSSSLDPVCGTRATIVVVQTDTERLHLCREGRSEFQYRVSLGRGGVGKSREGDTRTPLGTYPLGAPRSSGDFHLFIPVGYPTAAQRNAGLTGGDVGIHGPKRRWRWLGRLVNFYDWTAGCIAVNRDEDIKAIANWVRAYHAEVVSIVANPAARAR